MGTGFGAKGQQAADWPLGLALMHMGCMEFAEGNRFVVERKGLAAAVGTADAAVADRQGASCVRHHSTVSVDL